MAIGNLGGGKTTTPTTSGKGFDPNHFLLQMTAGGGDFPASGGGFAPGSETLASQIPQGFKTVTPASSAPAAAPAEADPWADFGILGQFFKLLDQSRVNAGMTSMADNKPMMDMLRTGALPLNNAYKNNTGSGS